MHQALRLLPALSVPSQQLPRMAGEWRPPSPIAQTCCQHSPCPDLPGRLLSIPAREPPALPQPPADPCVLTVITCVMFCQVSTAQAKLQYLRILNELPTFAGVLFNTVGLVR